MWPHYSVGHTGICLQFATSNGLFGGALKVFYRTSYPPFDLASRADGDELAVLLTRSAAWSYEHEYRLIGQDSARANMGGTILVTNHLVPIPEGSLSAVIVGSLATDATITAVREMIRESGRKIPLKRAEKARDRYELGIVDA
jgi:hypothetical protein